MTATRTRRARWPVIALALGALILVGCETENVIVVTNTTSTQLRVFVKYPGGYSTVSPTPGESSSIVVGEDGDFYAGAILDTDWLETIRTKQRLLNERLKDPEARRNLSVDEIQEMLAEIGKLTREIQQATEKPWENVGACTGTVSRQMSDMGESEDATAAKVTITDNPVGGFPAFILVCN